MSSGMPRVLNGILEDRNSDGDRYLIDIQTSVKVNAYMLSDNVVSLIRDDITKNDKLRASKIGIRIEEKSNSSEVILNTLKKLSKTAKERFYPSTKKVRFCYEQKEYFI